MAELGVPGRGHLLWSRRADFQTTSWSVIERAARGNRVDVDLALVRSRYWQPLYAFLRRRGHSDEAAEDLTQTFFARLIERSTCSRPTLRSIMPPDAEKRRPPEESHDCCRD